MVRDPGEAVQLAGKAVAAGAEAVEIRGDLFPTFPFRDIAGGIAVPAVFALRPRAQGGRFQGSESRRLDLLLEASRSGFRFVDVEAECGAEPGRFACPVLLSHHDFSRCPDDLPDLVSRLSGRGAAEVKVAVRAETAVDAVRILGLRRTLSGPLTLLGMGAAGLPTRILGAAWGNRFTYASLESGMETAEGQVPLEDLGELYRISRLGKETDVYGVVGNPALHSAGPRVHNRLFARWKLDAVYLPFEVDDPGPLLEAGADLGIRGLSVTMPFKARALDLADRAETLAERIGAANTLARSEAGWTASNTDAGAVRDCILRRRGPGGVGSVLLIGSGGAARAAAFALADAGGRVTVTGRSPDPGRRLAADVGGAFVPLADADAGGFDVVVQATPVGMEPRTDAEVLPGDSVRRGAVVLDMVYRPRRTRFLREAEAAGAEVVEGIEMFARQALGQQRLWTGLSADAAELDLDFV
jgi:3-dehydroquinate dehydratase/shikimate dehydrogenase